MATFFFRAVASDGKLRSGSLSGDNERVIARELRKQGLTPIYVGLSRMYRGMHYPLDVTGGALLGIAALAVIVFACRSAAAAAESGSKNEGR